MYRWINMNVKKNINVDECMKGGWKKKGTHMNENKVYEYNTNMKKNCTW